MKIAVEGCAHGDLEKIYETIERLEKKENIKVDVLLCCGDFQTSRNEEDLRCMAVPPKYYNICSFYKYYSGEKIAPILTILIGGNHEASNYLQELPYGGWVAPKIYYLGYAGVINIAGVRIAGLSGIYKDNDYLKGHFEIAPYDESTKRSVYHVRNLEVFRLKQLSSPIDIMLSHDWPPSVVHFGNKEQLIRFKPHFRDDIESGKLGSKPCDELLTTIKPKYWFAAHLHCKFAAFIPHEDGSHTKFLALDKCLPKRRFLQILDFPHDEEEEIKIKYDLEWLTTIVLTNHLTSIKSVANYMPGPHGNERYNFTPSNDEKNLILAKFNDDLTVPENFIETAEAYVASSPKKQYYKVPGPVQNPQTVLLCDLLNIDDPVDLILKKRGEEFEPISPNIKNNSNINNSDLSFINETILEEKNNSSNTDQRKSIGSISLALPQPKNESNDLFYVDTNPSEFKTNLSKRSNEDCNSEISVNVENDSSVKKNTLKRRNINIYKEDEI